MSDSTNTLTGIAELATEVRKNLALHEFDMPMHGHLAGSMFGREFDAKRGAIFKASSISVNAQNHGHPILTVYGQFTYKERTDSAASVNIRPTGTAWCRSSAWDGHGFKEMPDGARERVAEMVKDAVLELIPSESHWNMLCREAAGGELESKVRGSISESYRALENCLRLLGAES